MQAGVRAQVSLSAARSAKPLEELPFLRVGQGLLPGPGLLPLEEGLHLWGAGSLTRPSALPRSGSRTEELSSASKSAHCSSPWPACRLLPSRGSCPSPQLVPTPTQHPRPP